MAAAKVLLPAWLALTVQVPTATSVSVLPLTVHTAGVPEASCTDSPEVAVATRGGGVVPSVCAPGDTKLIVCADKGAEPTVKLRVTTAAAATLALPAWVAVMVQPPVDTSVSVVPLTVQTASVDEAKVTGNPALELATRAGGEVPNVWLPGELKVMVWAAGATLKVCVTGVAAEVVVLPAWLAVTVQLPAVSNVSAVPPTVHTAGVDDANDTVNPVLAVATRAGAAMPRVWPPGEAKLMVCVVSAAAATWKLRDTGTAAATRALPAWLALMVQVPTATRVRLVPLVVHTAGVVDANETSRPRLEVAARAGAAVPRVWLPGPVKVMVCTAGATLNERTTGAAAENTVLPAWLAVTLQLPTLMRLSTVPLTVQTVGVVELKLTARPEVAVATRAAGCTPRV